MPGGPPFPEDLCQRYEPDKTVDDIRQYGQTRDGQLYETHKGVRNVSTDFPPENDAVALRQTDPPRSNRA